MEIFGWEKGSKLYLSPKERSFYKRYQIIKDLSHELIQKKIDERKPDHKNVDILDFYVDAYLNQDENNEKITFQEIVDQFMAIYFAGTDTTANWASMAMYALAKHPEFYDKVR